MGIAFVGNKSLVGVFVGQTEVTKIYVGNELIYGKYSITNTITNGTASGDTEIGIGKTASVTIIANDGYTLPDTITVSGATYSYDNTTGVVALSEPTGDVTIEAECQASTPKSTIKIICPAGSEYIGKNLILDINANNVIAKLDGTEASGTSSYRAVSVAEIKEGTNIAQIDLSYKNRNYSASESLYIRYGTLEVGTMVSGHSGNGLTNNNGGKLTTSLGTESFSANNWSVYISLTKDEFLNFDFEIELN